MATTPIVGTETVSSALLDTTNANVDDLETRVQTCEALIPDVEDLQDAVEAIAAGSGVIVSANDTTPGVLNGKAVEGTNIAFTENNDGANETLTITNTDILGWF